jgi:hypothetical protein
VEASVRYSEHLMYLQRAQRAALGRLAEQHAGLARLCGLLDDLCGADGLPPQVWQCRKHHWNVGARAVITVIK